jgi:hypothetical protein
MNRWCSKETTGGLRRPRARVEQNSNLPVMLALSGNKPKN